MIGLGIDNTLCSITMKNKEKKKLWQPCIMREIVTCHFLTEESG